MSQDAGLAIGAYVWCFPNESIANLKSRLSLLDGFNLTSLWLDVEESGVSISDVNLALEVCDEYFSSKIGIYTGKWFFDQVSWSDQNLWSDRPLWDSNYDYKPNPDINFRPYGGWTMCQIKQYAGSVNEPIASCDLNFAR